MPTITDVQLAELLKAVRAASTALKAKPPKPAVARARVAEALDILKKITATRPAGELPVTWFKIEVPATWKESDGPVPVRIGAMHDDGHAAPGFAGVVTLSMMAYGEVTRVFDSTMRLLPSLETTAFVGGSWTGYVALH